MKQFLARLKKNPYIKYPLETLTRFGNDNGALNAAGLSFFMLVSFAPMILMGVALLSLFVKPSAAVHEVHIMVNNLLPAGGARTESDHFLNERLSTVLPSLAARSGLPLVFGLLSLLWSSMQIYVTGSTAMNMAFEVKEKRSWIKLRLIAVGLLLVSGALLLVSLFLSGAPNAIHAYRLPIIDRLPVGLPVLSLIFEVIAVIVNALLFGVVYKFLPNAKTTWRSVFVGGLTASVLFEVAKKGMAVFLLRPNNSIYGGLADLIVFVLWIYYSMTIMLLGSEVAAVYAKYNEHPAAQHLKAGRRLARKQPA